VISQSLLVGLAEAQPWAAACKVLLFASGFPILPSVVLFKALCFFGVSRLRQPVEGNILVDANACYSIPPCYDSLELSNLSSYVPWRCIIAMYELAGGSRETGRPLYLNGVGL